MELINDESIPLRLVELKASFVTHLKDKTQYIT